MSATVELGAVRSQLLVTENYTETILNIVRNIEGMVSAQVKAGEKIKSESDKLKSVYERTAAALDPVVARSQKYEQTVGVLKKALTAGLISQEQFNAKIKQAGDKYGETQRTLRILESETKKLGDQYQRLAEKLDPALRKTAQYEDQIDILNRSLKAGIINQDTYNKRVAQLGASIDKSLERMRELGSNLSETGAILTRLAVPIAAIGAYSTKAAIDFESSFAGVAKTVDATEGELRSLSKEIRDLAAGPDPIPVDVNQLNAIAESAGQLGVAKDYILDFTETVANLGNTTNLTFDESANGIAQFQNIFGEAGKDVDRLASTIVALGNKGASTEKQILEMGLRIAGAGKQIGLTQGEVLGIASALSSVGIEAEAGGSAISQLMIDMQLAIARGGKELHNFNEVAKSALPTGKDFATVFKEDASEGVAAFFRGLVNIQDSGGDVLKLLDDMGISGIRIRDTTLRAAGAGDLLANSLKIQDQAWAANNALTEEASKRYKTSQSQLTLLWQRVKDLAISIGQSLVPVLMSALDAVMPFLKLFKYAVDLFASAPKPVKLTVVAIAGLATAIGPALFITGQFISMWATLSTVAPGVVAAITSIRVAILGLTGIIAGVLLGINHIILKWKEAMEASIEYNVTAGNLEGRALKFAQDSKLSGGKVSSAAFQQAKKDLTDLEKKIKDAEKTVKSLNDTIKSGASTVDPRTGATYTNDAEVTRARKRIAEEQANLNSLRSAHVRLQSAIKGSKVETEKLANANGVLQPDIQDTTEEIDKEADALADLIEQALKAVEASRKERLEAEGALAARRKGTEALELYKTVRLALTKAEEAGTAATSAQRLEIIRNTFAIKAAETELDKLIKSEEERIRLFADTGGYEAYLALVEREKQLKERALELTRDMATEEERRAKAVAEAMALYESGLISSETLRRVNQSNAAPNFGRSQSEQENVEFIDNLIQSFRSVRSIAQEEMARIERAFESYADNADMMILKEQALASVRAQLLDQTLGEWGSFFQSLSGLFGGLFEDIANLIGRVQQAAQAGNQMGGILQSMGAGSWASALGGMFAVAQIFYEVYNIVDGIIEKRKNKRWSEITSVSVVDGNWSSPNYFNSAGEQVSESLRNLIQQIMDGLGAVIDDMPAISIKARRDGKQFAAYVGDVLVGTFNDMESAIQAAVQQALTSATWDFISPEFQQALTASVTGSFEDLQRNLEVAAQARATRLGDAGASYVERMDQLRRQMEAERALGLSIQHTIDAINRETSARINNALGIDTSSADAIRDLRSLSDGMAESSASMRASIQQQIDATLEEIARLEGSVGRSGSIRGGGFTSPSDGIDDHQNWKPNNIFDAFSDGMDSALGRLRRQLDQYRDELEKIPDALTDAQMNMGIFNTLYKYLEGSAKYAKDAEKYALMRIEAEFAALKMELELAGKWEMFAGMFNDAYNAARASAGQAVRGGGTRSGGSREQVRDFIEQKEWELAASGMSEYRRQMEEVTRQYQEQLSQAGRDTKLRDQLIALRDRELAQLERERNLQLTDRFREFTGVSTAFDNIRSNSKKFIDDINSSALGDPRKARMIARILAETERQLDALAQESARSLLGQMISDLERFGASEQLMAEARRQMAILEHTMKMANYEKEIAILKAEGRLNDEQMSAIEAAFNFLKGIDPTKFVPGPATTGLTPTGQALIDAINQRQADEANQLAEALKRARESLNKYKDDGLDPLTRNMKEIFSDFSDIKRYMGSTPEVISTFNQAVARAIDDFLEPIRQTRRDLFYGESSAVDTMTKWDRLQQEAELLKSRFRSGDLTSVEEINDVTDQIMDMLGDVVPMGSDRYSEIQEQWDNFLAEVETNTPGLVNAGQSPLPIQGMDDLAALGEVQVDRLQMLYGSSERVVETLNQIKNSTYNPLSNMH